MNLNLWWWRNRKRNQRNRLYVHNYATKKTVGYVAYLSELLVALNSKGRIFSL